MSDFWKDYEPEPTRPAPVQSCYCPNCEAMGKELAALKAQPAPVQEPVDTLIAAWQAIEETSGHVLDVGDVEGRMHISVIRSAWEQMDSLVREIWDERGRS